MIRPARFPLRHALSLAAAAIALTWGASAQAHCDTLDGPVVSQARKALDSGNVNLVLGWVQQRDEAEIRKAFQQAVSVRKASPAAKELADRSFFETLVRVHRAGEGAPYTGLKPAGEVEPPIAAADQALATGKLEPVGKMVMERVENGLHQRFEAVAAKKKYDPNDVAAARAYVAAYVPYVHYVEGLYNAAADAAGEHGPLAQDQPAAQRERPAAPPAGHAH